MNNKIVSALIIMLSVITDRLTKIIAATNLRDSGIGSVDIISDVLSLTYHENRCAAFGMFADSRWICLVFSLVGILAVLVYLFFFKESNKLVTSSLALIAGGGIGNMIDRISNGYVVDFIYFEIIDFPIFNVADICVTCGSFLLIIYLLSTIKQGDVQGS